MATCAVAAVYAPVAGAATVSNANTDAVATYAPEATDVTHSLVLGTDLSLNVGANCFRSAENGLDDGLFEAGGNDHHLICAGL